MFSYEILDSTLVNDLAKEGFVKLVHNVVLPMTIVVKPIEAQNEGNLPVVVEPSEVQNNNDLPIEAQNKRNLPIVVEPVEAQNNTDLRIEAQNNINQVWFIDHKQEFQVALMGHA